MARLIRNNQVIPTNLLTRFLNSPRSLLTHPHTISKRSLQTLAYEEIEANSYKPYTHTALILHGLLGSSRNWRSFSRNLASSLSPPPLLPWRMVLVDLRNHGKSAEIEGLDPPHDMVNAAKDLGNLVNSKGWDWPDVLIGHSMGGKVALQFAQRCANRDYGENVKLPKQNTAVVVLDSVPGEVTSGNSDGEVEKVLQTAQRCANRDYGENVKLPKQNTAVVVLDSVPGEVTSGNSDGEVEKVLQTLKSLPSTVPSRNVDRDQPQEIWRMRDMGFNLEGAVQMFHSYREISYWSLLEHPPKGLEIAIVRAEKSDRWDADVINRLERLASQEGDGSAGKILVHVLPNSGHWVHVDNPKGLLEIVAPKLKSLMS